MPSAAAIAHLLSAFFNRRTLASDMPPESSPLAIRPAPTA